MSDLNQAALLSAGFTAIFLFVVFLAWRARRPQAEPAAPQVPKVPRQPSEGRMPRLQRRTEPQIEPVDIAPSRLARISKAAVEAPMEPPEPYGDGPLPPMSAELLAETPKTLISDLPAVEPPIDPAPSEPAPSGPAIDETILDALAVQAERQAHQTDAPLADGDRVRLVPQIPPRDAILRKSWIGGRPRLPATIEWPLVDGREGDFLAQIACDTLPPTLWDGLGPRTGWLAFFTNPDSGAATALHLPIDGPPRDAPRPVGPAYFHPLGLDSIALRALAVQAVPEWPVDVVAGPAALRGAEAPVPADYDVGDPAFHPFDWASMLAMAQIIEDRILALPNDGVAPDDANDELAEAIADAAEANREAAQRTAEIIAIIRESAAADTGFSPTDATAVMAALHAVHWTQVTARPDPESGVDEVETLALPLTRRRPDGDLWVEAWRHLLFDHAKHAWCAHPGSLSAPARAFFEPLWQSMAAEGIASMGQFPSLYTAGFDVERDLVLLELPPSKLLGLARRDGGSIVFAIRKADFAAGDFATIRVLAGN